MIPEQFEEIFEKIRYEPNLPIYLRKLILNLAMNGLLTSIVNSDGNTQNLISEIKSYRQQLIKSKAIKDNKVTFGTLPEDLPNIPSHWAWTKLGLIGDWGSGSTPKRGESAFYGGNNIWLKSGELKDNKEIADSEEKVTEKALSEWSFRKNQPGDVLISMYGTIGSLGIIAKEAVTNQAVCGCTPFKGVDNHFLFYFLQSYRANFIASGVGVTQSNISKEKIVATYFPLPPLEEQKRIVVKVDEFMALCDDLEKSQANGAKLQKDFVASSLAKLQTEPNQTFENFLKSNFRHFSKDAPLLQKLKNELLSLAVQGKLRKHNTTEPHFIPLGELCTKTGSGSTPLGGKSVYQKSGIVLLRSQNVYDDGLRLNSVVFIKPETHEKMKGTKVCPGDLLLNIVGGSIGRCCIVPKDAPEMNITQNISIIRLKDKDIGPFLHLVIISPYFQNHIINEQTGSGRKILPKKKMDKIPIPIFSTAEQQEITQQAKKIVALLDQLEANLEKEAAIKADLLKTLVA